RERAATVLGREVGDDPVRGNAERLELGDRAVEPLLSARGERDIAAFLRESLCNREADALTRARDRRTLALQAEIHDQPPSDPKRVPGTDSWENGCLTPVFPVFSAERELELLDEPVELLLLHDQRRRE